ncbi:MAG: NUDIX hydrolase [Flavobacteriales bacterium]
MYEVFINQHLIIFSNSEQNSSKIFSFNERCNWQDIFDLFENKKPQIIHVKSVNLSHAWSSFKSNFKLIKAAGGLVLNNKSILFILRNGKWDLPKGKLEKGESIEQCAVREVMEECGIDSIELKHKLINTYHIYMENDTMILKETHWYLMLTSFSAVLTPQLEEGISSVEWIGVNNLQTVLANTYENIKRVIQVFTD